MTSLWLTEAPATPSSTPVLAQLKLLRRALRFFEPEADMSDAEATLRVHDADGFVCLGTTSEMTPTVRQDFETLREHLRNEGFITQVDLDPERYASQMRARRATRAGASPEEVFAQEAPGVPLTAPVIRPAEQDEPISVAAYRTGQVLLTMAEGNPLRAAAFASMLARTTGDSQVFGDTIVGLMRSFPWLEQEVHNQGLMP